jgi:hypothetical protein
VRLIVFLLIAISTVAVPRAGAPVAVMEVGSLHGEDARPLALRNGQQWLGLFPSGKSYEWQRVQLHVEAAHDEIVDEGTEAMTGVDASVDHSGQPPLFLLRGMDFLAQTKVFAVSGEVELLNGKGIPLLLNGTTYHLKVTNSKTKRGEIGIGSVATLKLGKQTQVLFALSGSASEPIWKLVWAGDLDGDGKLDIYVDMSDHYNVSMKRLFLSSQAPRGKLVTEVAKFRTTGC